MKNRVVRALALAMALALLGGAALAEVRTTANVWMREAPNLEGKQVTSYAEGKSLDYLGESSVDERGVAWYKVTDGKNTGWVSSKYTELIGEEAAEPEAAEDAAEAEADTDAEPVELSGYYLTDLVAAANEIGLISYRQVESEAPYQYYDDSVIVAGNQDVENIVIYAGGYQLFGVKVGMNVINATAQLTAAGLVLMDSADGVSFQHIGGETSHYVTEEGYDSCVNLWVDEDGAVTEIDWSTYTG